MVTIDVVYDTSRFCSMKNNWDALLNQSGILNPYLTHGWLSSWWDAYKEGKKLNIVVFKDKGATVGFIPLAVTTEFFCGIPMRTLKFFADHWGTMDFIIAEKRRECIEEFIGWFYKTKAADVLILSRMPKDSENTKVMEELLEEHKYKYERTDLKNTVIHLDKDWDTYVNGLSKKFRYEIKHKKQTLSEMGEVKYERITDVKSAKDVLDSLVAVAEKSWKEKGKKGIAVSEEGLQFYRNVSSRWNGGNSLDVSLLQLDNRPIAFATRLNYKNIFYALETAYDQSLYDYSPGLVVNSYLLESLLKDGSVKRYELGETDDHKKRWSEEYVSEIKFVIYNKNIVPSIAYYLKNIATSLETRLDNMLEVDVVLTESVHKTESDKTPILIQYITS